MKGYRRPQSTTYFNTRKRKRSKSLTYRLTVLAAPIFLIPVFLIIILAFCFIVVPLLYLLLCTVIIRSGWSKTTEFDYWADERYER